MTPKPCRTCGKPIDDSHGDVDYHPIECWPEHEPLPGIGITPYDLELREELTQIIQWADHNSERSQQVKIGASEIGMDCTRRLAYRIAGVPSVHRRMDGWPAIVGTSIHGWMEKAFNRYMEAHGGGSQWQTELTVLPDPLVGGHTDLYRPGLVLDWKFPSTDNLKKLQKSDWSQQYRVQLHTYGKGHVDAGRRVDRVGLVAIARQGSLKTFYCKTEPYRPEIAQWGINRVYGIGGFLIKHEGDPTVFDKIPATPSRLCGYCPWYRPNMMTGASDKGCPGN